MSRRLIGAMGRRPRGCGGGGIGSCGAGLPGPQALLGANLVELWDSRQGVATITGAVTSWTGLVASTSVPAATPGERPAYVASAYFGGASVVSTEVVGTRLYSTTNLSPALLTAGARPYICSVFRRTTQINDGQQKAVITYSAASNLPVMELRDLSADSTTLSAVYQNQTGTAIAIAFADIGSAHIAEVWLEPANGLCFRFDGGSTQKMAQGSDTISGDITLVSISALIGGFYRFGAFEHALHLITTVYPGDTLCASLRAYIHQAFSF